MNWVDCSVDHVEVDGLVGEKRKSGVRLLVPPFVALRGASPVGVVVGTVFSHLAPKLEIWSVILLGSKEQSCMNLASPILISQCFLKLVLSLLLGASLPALCVCFVDCIFVVQFKDSKACATRRLPFQRTLGWTCTWTRSSSNARSLILDPGPELSLTNLSILVQSPRHFQHSWKCCLSWG